MNDPTNWNTDEVGSFAFASPEEAKKAEAVMNRALKDSFNNGLEIAARYVEDEDVESAGTRAAAIRAMKCSTAAPHEGEQK